MGGAQLLLLFVGAPFTAGEETRRYIFSKENKSLPGTCGETCTVGVCVHGYMGKVSGFYFI